MRASLRLCLPQPILNLEMKLTFLGTGTSYGVPYVGCDCDVCTSENPCNKRLRASVLMESGETRILVDTTPDLRQQLLREKVRLVSGVLWTHSHNDHIIGLDDLRPLSDRQGYIEGWTNEATLEHLQHVFPYALHEGREHGGFPRVSAKALAPREEIQIGEIGVTAIRIRHGRHEIFAYRFRAENRTLIYATDCSYIPDESRDLMKNADVLVLGALRHEPHIGHFSLSQAVGEVADLQPRRALFTHIAHDLEHEATNATLPENVKLAFDGLRIEL